MNHKIHHLPVVVNSKLMGIITTYDMWKNKVAPSEYETTSVSEVMATQIAKIRPSDKIGTAAELFLDNRFHALPVVDENNHLRGIVTSFDVLLYEFKKEYPNPILYKHLFEKNQVNLAPA
jgi:CBS domain-containing protein